MTIPALEHLRKYNIPSTRIANRYVQALMMYHNFIDEHNFEEDVFVNQQSVKRALIDYFIDIARVKAFHDITNTNRAKIYSYAAHWLLRRKPLQVKAHFKGSEFINELFVTYYILALISEAKGISDVEKEQNPAFGKFQSFLYYNLCYRPVSQQSLELMIEAFFCGYSFTTEEARAANKPEKGAED